MANNVMQQLRSNTSATPGSLLAGQIAFSSVANLMYIGSPASGTPVTPVGGVYNFGTLTANQALVANSTSGINTIWAGTGDFGNTTANLVINSSALTLGAVQINANGGIGTAGWALLSGGAGANNYWAAVSGGSSVGAAATTDILFDDAGVANGTNGFTFTKATNTISIGNSTVNATINSTVFSATALLANNAAYLGTIIAAAYVQNNFTGNLTGAITHTANVAFSGANVWVSSTNTYISSNTILAGTNTVISSNLTLSGGLLTATTTNATFGNMTVSGNLVINGTLESINTSQLVVNDNIIELAYNNITTDTVDTGIFSPAGNSSLTWYSIFGRVAGKSTNANPYFVIASSNTNPNTAATFDLSVANSSTGFLQAYLVPYGAAGAFVANSTVVNITANSTLSSALVANSLTLTTALLATYGGTGKLSYAAGDLLYAATANPTALTSLAAAANGNVLQITNNLPSYSSLDGGTF